jgi:hypothetical protein
MQNLKKQVKMIQMKNKFKEMKKIKKWDHNQIQRHGMMMKILILMKVMMSLDSILQSKLKKSYIKKIQTKQISMIKKT